MALRIPDTVRASFSKLASYSDIEAEALINALRDAHPSILSSPLVEQVISKTGKTTSETIEIVRALINLYSIYEAGDATAEQFSAEVIQALEEQVDPNLPKTDWQTFKRRLVTILGLDKTLGVTAKAQDARSEYHNVFCHSRVWTDLRPLFSANTEDSPAGMVIVHTLRIVFHEEHGHKEFYIALDIADIRELKSQLERALQKEGTLKKFVEGTSTPFLGAEY